MEYSKEFRMRGILIACGAALALSGCASVVRGTTEKVEVRSEPSGAVIRTSLGSSCPASPCTFQVPRKTEFVAYAEKPGFKPGSIQIGTKVGGGGAAGMAGNVIAGGIIGFGVDAATGAALDHYPNPATIQLAPVNSSRESTKAVARARPAPRGPSSQASRKRSQETPVS
jgi:hypothetical protein